jgi:3-oxoacyl-[acyl-carrier protein] reductase
MESMTYISGATGYVGIRLVEHLASRGRDLLLSARDEKKLHEVVKKIADTYPNQSFRGFACDLGNPESWVSAVEHLNQFSVLEYINCSGIQGQLGPSSEVSYEESLNVFNVNLFSSMFFTNHFASSLREGDKLSIIHFSGGGSTSPRPLFMSYSLSKTSLLRFVENFAAENPDRNIKINAIAPGVMPSKMQSEIIDNEWLRNSKERLTALNSLSNLDSDLTKLLKLCDFLLSDKSAGITGKLISAEWDDWAEWPNHLGLLKDSDLYTLRRIIGRDRGQEWGDL